MNVNELYEKRASYYLAPSASAKGATLAGMVLGLVVLIAGMAMGESQRVWGAFLFNLFFFFSIALGGAAFSGMQDIVGAIWGRPIKRLHEGFAAFVPVAAGLFVAFLLLVGFHVAGAEKVYSWIADPSVVAPFFGKDFWLQPWFMVVRNIVAVVLMAVLVLWQLKTNVARDVEFASGRRDEALRLAESSRVKLRYWSAPVLIIYAIGFSLMAFDLLMSLAPMWISTLWGGWQFAIMMQTLMAFLLVVMFSLKSTPIGAMIGRQQFHDVGKLMHGFTVFFAYLTYAHILTYWYGNMPEETEYFIHRLHAPWIYIVIGAPIFCFVVPLYGMIWKKSKWTAGITIPMCLIILTAQWFVQMLVVMPEVVEADKFGLPWIEVGLFLGFFGLFLSCFFWFGKRYPMVSLADPLLQRAFDEAHH